MKPLSAMLLVLALGAGAIALRFASGTEDAAARVRGDPTAMAGAEDPDAARAFPSSVIERPPDASEQDDRDTAPPTAAWTSANQNSPQVANTVVGNSDAIRTLSSNEEIVRQTKERERLDLLNERRTATRRASRVAEELELSAGETLQLADSYLAIGVHRRETLAAMRAGGLDQEAMKQVVLDLRQWQLDLLTGQFGTELGQRIDALDPRWSPSGELEPSAGSGGAQTAESKNG